MEDQTGMSSTEPIATPAESGTWAVLAMTTICMMVVGFNMTAVATILPNIKAELDLTPAELQWVMAIYTVTSATLISILSRLGDISGKMSVFLFGIVIFALGSALVLFSENALMLLAGRCAQGAGGAAMFGTSLTLLTAATPEDRRGAVVGFWGATAGLSLSVGPIVGGAFATYLSWRGIFATDLVLLAAALIIALYVQRQKAVPDTRMPGARLDKAGAIALVLLLGPLSFALSNGESQGWTSMQTLLPLLISGLAAIALILTARRSDDPLVELRYFRHPRYVMAGVGMFVTGFALLCFFVFFSVFVQSPDSFGYDAIRAGLAVVPLSASMFIVSFVAPRLLAPYSSHWPIAFGMAAMALGFFLLSTAGNSASYFDIWWKLVIIGTGLGLCFSLLPRLGLRLLPDEHAGQGSGVINTFLYFGATLGTVVGGVAAAVTTRSGLSEVIAALPKASTQRADLVHALTHGSPSTVQHLISGLDPQSGAALASALRNIQDNAFDSAMLVSAVGTSVGLLLAILLLRGPVPPLRDAMRFTQKG